MLQAPDLAIIVPAYEGTSLPKALESIAAQKDTRTRVYVADDAGSPEIAAVVADYESRLDIRHHRFDANMGQASMVHHLRRCLELAKEEEWVMFLSEDNELGEDALKRLRRCIRWNSGFDVFHWDTDVIDAAGNVLRETRGYPRKVSSGKLFKEIFVKEAVAPLSSFVFRRSVLAEKYVSDDEAWRMELATILNAAGEKGVRTVRGARLRWREKAPGTALPASRQDRAAQSAIRFFLWSESFFGEDYPIGVSDRMELFAGSVAGLYPSYTADDLKTVMYSFTVVDGALRKMKAASALKSALKQREESLSGS